MNGPSDTSMMSIESIHEAEEEGDENLDPVDAHGLKEEGVTQITTPSKGEKEVNVSIDGIEYKIHLPDPPSTDGS